jgi:hypothetical protein
VARAVLGPSAHNLTLRIVCGGRESQQNTQSNNGRAQLRVGQPRARSCRSVAMAGGEETVRVRIDLDGGRLELELYPSRAPLTVANFLQYVDAGTCPTRSHGTSSTLKLVPHQSSIQGVRDRALQRERPLLPRRQTGQPAA